MAALVPEEFHLLFDITTFWEEILTLRLEGIHHSLQDSLHAPATSLLPDVHFPPFPAYITNSKGVISNCMAAIAKRVAEKETLMPLILQCHSTPTNTTP